MDNETELAYCDYAPQSEYIGFCVSMPVIMIVMMIFICGGNCLTIMAVWKTPSLQTMPNMYIVSLAVADFITGLAYGYDSLWYISSTMMFIYNCKACCLVSIFMLYTGFHVSMASVVAIAIDRYVYIMHPFLYNRLITASLIQIILAVVWVVSTLFAATSFFINNFEEVGFCAHFGVLPVWYHVYTEMSIFVFVFLTCVIINGAIVRLTLSKRREMRTSSVTAAAYIKHKNDWRAVRMMLTICGAFFVCWLPYHIAMLANHFGDIWMFMFDVLSPIAILNSCMNFFIYVFMNRIFRRAFRKILCCSQANPNGPTDGD
ncbi:G-protein coupled receptor moody-like, partial [Gigantopelta aegis]|uniref:G-protein coupled receptor moody-like n=1 Tax=Gigantopelta aegis TaxID=1735272 RepID=UPI001B88BE0D